MEKHGYRLFIEQKYLHQVQRRASALREFKLVSILYKNNELVFKLRSGTPPYKKIWTQRVVIQDLNSLKVARMKFNDLAKFIQEANLKVSCDCEAFLYWGGAYWSYRKGFGLIKELRRPRVRQPLYQKYFCFAKGTLITSQRGLIPIEDVQPGELVYDKDGMLVKVRATIEGSTNEWVRFRVGRDKVVECTPEHKFLCYPYEGKQNSSTKVFDSTKVKWIEAKDLKPGYHLLSPTFQNSKSLKVSKSLSFALGLYASDGNIHAYQTRTGINFSYLNISYNIKYKEIYKRIFKNYNLEVLKEKSVTSSGGSFVLSSSLIEFLVKNVGVTCSKFGLNKFFNEEILSWDKESKNEFLKGFFLGDGTIVEGSGSVSNRSTYITLYNTNESLMWGVFRILKEDYPVELKFYDRNSFVQNGRLVKPKRMFYIRIVGGYVRKFIDEVLDEDVLLCKGLYSPTMRITNYVYDSHKVDGIEMYSSIIKEVTPFREQKDFYCLETESGSLLINGLIASNCKHIYAVMRAYPWWSRILAKKYKQHVAETQEVNMKGTPSNDDLLNEILFQ